LCDELAYYLAACDVEQDLGHQGRVPTVAEYWAYRHGVGAIGFNSAGIE
jgi:hypothetical protein